MLIDFSTIPEAVVPHMRGGEREVHTRNYDDGMTKLMRGRLIPGATIGLHTHEDSCEVIYILSGTGKVLYDGSYESLSPGSCHYCPKGHAHSLINDSQADLEYLAIVPKQ